MQKTLQYTFRQPLALALAMLLALAGRRMARLPGLPLAGRRMAMLPGLLALALALAGALTSPALALALHRRHVEQLLVRAGAAGLVRAPGAVRHRNVGNREVLLQRLFPDLVPSVCMMRLCILSSLLLCGCGPERAGWWDGGMRMMDDGGMRMMAGGMVG